MLQYYPPFAKYLLDVQPVSIPQASRLMSVGNQDMLFGLTVPLLFGMIVPLLFGYPCQCLPSLGTGFGFL